ncbi:NADase-type glycan-binding domain-containing protein [Clostridium sp. DL1XJH146]
MFCPKCGKKREGEAKFCGGCGYRFQETTINDKENSEDIIKPQAIINANVVNEQEKKEQQSTVKQSNTQNAVKQDQYVKNTAKTKGMSNKSIIITIVGVAFVVVVLAVVMVSIIGGDNNSNNGNLIADSNNNDIEDVKNDDTDNNSKDNSLDNIDNSQNNIENNTGSSIENNTSDNSNNPNDIEDNSNPIEDNGEIDYLLYDDKYIEPLSIEASSYLESTSNGHYFPENINDYNNETAWVESVPGDGSGQWIQLNFEKETTINGIDFEIGYRKSEETYFKNNRPKNVRVEFSDGSDFYIEFSDGFGYGSRVETDSVKTTYVKVIIEDVYKGSSYDDTCISEIHVY